MRTFFNEIDPYAAQWLRNLGEAGEISKGVVDERSIKEVRGADLAGARRAHFFAGIGGWDLALKLAGWPTDREVWTGSCPCQPFSHAGARKAELDPRHLWPDFFRLIGERRPATIFGEQTSSPLGRDWLDRVLSDLETLGYAVAASDLCAAGVGAPHRRSRLYWVAHSDGGRFPWESQSDKQKAGSVEAPRRGDIDGRGDPLWSTSRPVEGADGTWRLFVPGVEPLVDGLPPVMGRLHGFGNAIVPALAAEFIASVMEVL